MLGSVSALRSFLFCLSLWFFTDRKASPTSLKKRANSRFSPANPHFAFCVSNNPSKNFALIVPRRLRMSSNNNNNNGNRQGDDRQSDAGGECTRPSFPIHHLTPVFF